MITYDIEITVNYLIFLKFNIPRKRGTSGWFLRFRLLSLRSKNEHNYLFRAKWYHSITFIIIIDFLDLRIHNMTQSSYYFDSKTVGIQILSSTSDSTSGVARIVRLLCKNDQWPHLPLHERTHRTVVLKNSRTKFWESNMRTAQNCKAQYYFTTTWTLPYFKGRMNLSLKPIFLQSFQNRMELTRELECLIVDMTGLQNGPLFASVLSPRNPRWRQRMEFHIFEKKHGKPNNAACMHDSCTILTNIYPF